MRSFQLVFVLLFVALGSGCSATFTSITAPTVTINGVVQSGLPVITRTVNIDKTPHWKTFTKSYGTNSLYLLMFGATWCGPCSYVYTWWGKQHTRTPMNFIYLKAYSSGTERVAAQIIFGYLEYLGYSKKKASYPTIFVMSKHPGGKYDPIKFCINDNEGSCTKRLHAWIQKRLR